jgi:hypothetical protein
MLAKEGTETDVSKSPEQFNRFLNEDAKFWIKLVKSAGVTVDLFYPATCISNSEVTQLCPPRFAA